MLLVLSTTGDMRIKMVSLLVVTTKDASISTNAAQLDSRRLGHKKKWIKLGNPSPPTPTKDKIIKFDRTRRDVNPACLHFGVE
jgi:hypothetical protein